MDWLAKASLISTRSMSAMPSPARCRTRVACTGPMPMISGAQPATATALIRARIASPWRRANSSLQTSSAALPSVSGDEVAAVTLPPNAGFSWARLSRLVPGRMQPSSATRPAGCRWRRSPRAASRPRARRLPWRGAYGHLFLLDAADGVALGDILGGLPHAHVYRRIVLQQRGIGRQVEAAHRHPRHRLYPGGDEGFSGAQQDLPGGVVDSAHGRTAETVEGRAAEALRKPARKLAMRAMFMPCSASG